MHLMVGAAERRHESRETASPDPPRFEFVNSVLASYWEMPGLNLTIPEAARVFGVRLRTCEVVFEDLVVARVLQRSDQGRYTLRAQDHAD